jgi:PadR family transcriptional regulator PadR
MAFRKPCTLLLLEEQMMHAMIEHGELGVHGFALAQELAASTGATSLAAHGTLYKALDRLRNRGLIVAEWEPPELAEEAGRPRRRLYRLTAEGAQVLRAAQVPQPGPRLGAAPA